MRRFAKSFALFLSFAALLGGATHAGAVACTSVASGSWTTVATWGAAGNPCSIAGGNATDGPGADDTVTISNSHVITTPAAAQAAASLAIAAGATATSLTLGGNLTVNGDVTIFGSTGNVTRTLSVNSRILTVTGNVTINGGTAGPGATNISQLTITSGRLNATGNVTVNAGTAGTAALATLARMTVTTSTGATATTIGGNLIINGGTTVGTQNDSATVSLTSGRVTVTGNTILTGGIAATNDALLTIAGASVAGNGYVLNGDLSVLSPSITGSSSVTMTGAAGGRIDVGGNVDNRDTMTLAAGIFRATNAASTFAIGNAAVTAASHVSSTTVTSGSLTIAGNTTVTAGSINPSGATLSVTTGSITIGILATPRNLTVTAGSAANTNATASVTSGTLSLPGASVTTLNGRIGGTGGTASLLASLPPAGAGVGIDLGGNLTSVTTALGGVGTAVTNLTGGGVINVAGTVNNGGTVTIATGTFNLTGASSAYNNTSAVVVANTTITTGTLNLSGATPTLNNAAGETMSVTSTGNITVGNPATATGTLTNAGTITLAATLAGSIVNANGTFTNSGAFTHDAVRASQLFLRGATSTINGTYTRGIGTVTMNRLTPLVTTQTLSGTALTAASGFNNLVVNNTTGFGVTLGSLVAVRGTLTFTSGNVTTGANSLVTVASCTVPSVVRASGHVIGFLQKAIPATATACTFEVGSGNDYTPVVTAFSVAPTAGNVTASTTGAEHPSIGLPSSVINPAASVNRYWTLTNGPAPLITGGTFTATFNFINGSPVDFDAGADPAKFTVQRFSGGAWTVSTVNATCVATPGTNLCNQVNGLTSAAGFGDFAIGETTYTIGNAGWFNVFETVTGAGAHLGNVYTKIVGTAFGLDVVAVNARRDGVKPGYSTNPITVELLDASDNSGALNAETDCRATWALIPLQSFSLSPVWASSRATVTIPLQTSAAREVRVRVTQGTLVACSTNNFTIRPTVFTVSSTDATNTGTSGTPAIKAGANFNLTAASVAGYNGTPSVDNTAAMVVGTPTQGAIGGSFSAAPIGTGTATDSAFTYSEVGNFGLAANAIFDSSFTVDSSPGDCNVGFSNTLDGAGRYGCSIGSTAVPQTTGVSGFGRFKPDHFFLVAAATLTNRSASACAPASTFTYMDENFQLGFTLRARNAASVVTTNYQGAYAKLDLSTAAALALGARYGTTNLTPRLDTALAPSGSFVSGDAALTVTLRVTRAAAPDGPFAAARVGIAPNDSDPLPASGTQLVPAALDLDVDNDLTNDHQQVGANTEFRFGRLRMQNASGREKIDLPIPLQAQYWTGTVFATNADDSCTSLTAANLPIGAYTGGITGTNMGSPGHISLGGAFASGVGSLKLTKPSPVPTSPGAATVTIDLAAEAKTYLQGNWGGAGYTFNPSARAGFGLFGSQPRNFIFFRENY